MVCAAVSRAELREAWRAEWREASKAASASNQT